MARPLRIRVGQVGSPPWLDSAGLHGYLLGREARSASDRERASARYAVLVAEGYQVHLWDTALRQQIYVGDEPFVERMQALAAPQASVGTSSAREEALARAYTESGLSMTAIARELGLSVSRVSRLIAKAEAVGSER